MAVRRAGTSGVSTWSVGRAVGLTDDDVRRVAEGPDADGWTSAEVAALRATDELHDRATISDPTWAALSEHFSVQQILDLVFLVGNYHVVSLAAERVPGRARRRRRRHRVALPAGRQLTGVRARARARAPRRERGVVGRGGVAGSGAGMPPEIRAGNHS